MDWDDLRIFLAVARSESLSAAGRRLKIDPATVGRRIARLEEAVGSRLFSKSPQGYALTEGGTRLLVHAEQAERAVTGAEASLSGPKGLTGLIRLGAPDGCANYLLPQVLARLCDVNPGLEVQTVQKLTDYRLHLAASRDYLARHPIDRVEDLKNHPFVGYIPDLIFDKELDYLSEIGAPPVTFSSNSVSVQLNFLRQGAGLGVVHDFALPAATELQRVLADRISLQRAFWLIRHADDGRVERLNRFAEALVRECRVEIGRLETL